MGILLTESAAAEAGAGVGMGMVSIIYIVVIFGAFYFFMFRPQKKEQKKIAVMLSALEIGDCVLTTSGFTGLSLILLTTRLSWNLAIIKTAVSP